VPGVNLAPYAKEVEGGLSNEIPDMDAALERQAFYDYEGTRYEHRFKRDAESSFDFAGRSHRSSGFLNECIRKLCQHAYAPGPARRWSEKSAQDFLQRVYQENFIDAVMLEADKLSTLNATVAIQIDPGEGVFDEKPITYRLWGREEHCVWVDPDNANVASVVCTVDKYDGQKRARLWSDTQVQTFLTKKVRTDDADSLTTRAFYPAGPPIEHGYGCLPFTFVHYHLPIRSFDVTAIGEFLHKAEVAIDNRLMRLDESIHKHLNPIPWAAGMPPDWKPNLEAQRFVRMPPRSPQLNADGSYEEGEYAELGYLQAQIDVAGAWEDCRSYMNQAIEAADIPISAVRMEQQGIASGISLIVEQEPLIKRAEVRRLMYKVYEDDLGKRTLIVAGNHYGMPELATAGVEGHIILAWPQPRLAVNTPDKLELTMGEVAANLKSHLMAIQDWYGVGRDEALEIAEQIAIDDQELAAANPMMALMMKAKEAALQPDQEGPAGDNPERPRDEPGAERQF
jgi:hypothetical protein